MSSQFFNDLETVCSAIVQVLSGRFFTALNELLLKPK